MGMRADNHVLNSLHCTYIIAYLRGQPDSGCLTQVLYRQLSRPSSSCEGLLRQTNGDHVTNTTDMDFACDKHD